MSNSYFGGVFGSIFVGIRYNRQEHDHMAACSNSFLEGLPRDQAHVNAGIEKHVCSLYSNETFFH